MKSGKQKAESAHPSFWQGVGKATDLNPLVPRQRGGGQGEGFPKVSPLPELSPPQGCGGEREEARSSQGSTESHPTVWKEPGCTKSEMRTKPARSGDRAYNMSNFRPFPVGRCLSAVASEQRGMPSRGVLYEFLTGFQAEAMRRQAYFVAYSTYASIVICAIVSVLIFWKLLARDTAAALKRRWQQHGAGKPREPAAGTATLRSAGVRAGEFWLRPAVIR